MGSRKNVPSREKIAKHWDLDPDKCWACELEREVCFLEKAHIVAHVAGGSDNDPANYVLLCKECHGEAPDHGDPAAMWHFIHEHELDCWRVWRLIGELFKQYPLATLVYDRYLEFSDLVDDSHVPGSSFKRKATRAWLTTEVMRLMQQHVAETYPGSDVLTYSDVSTVAGVIDAHERFGVPLTPAAQEALDSLARRATP